MFLYNLCLRNSPMIILSCYSDKIMKFNGLRRVKHFHTAYILLSI